MTDSDSGSAWTPDGRAIDGPLKGKKLTRLEVQDGVYWSVARFWFKHPPLLTPQPAKPALDPQSHRSGCRHITHPTFSIAGHYGTPVI